MNKGSDRLGQRARKASSLFREMLQTDNNDMVIREANPRVTMMLAINMRPDPQLENSLDYSERDDQLVGIASAYSNNFPDTEVSVLTYDTGPMLSAKNVGVKWTDFPQSWLLEPETSETEKTIRRLQTQLEQVRNAGPVVDLRCTDKTGEPVKRLDVSVKLINRPAPWERGQTTEVIPLLWLHITVVVVAKRGLWVRVYSAFS